jgi:AAA domain
MALKFSKPVEAVLDRLEQDGQQPQGKTDKAAADRTIRLLQSSAEFTANYVLPDYLIDGILQQRFVYSLTARTGTGKTSLVLLFAAHVGEGLAFGMREVERGAVLIFAGENPDDIRARWIAMSQRVPFDIETIPVYFIPGRFKISQLIERIRQEVRKLGGVKLLIIDTSAAYFEGEDENSNVQLGAHAARLRGLDLPGGPCTIINCHPTKNAPDDNLVPRGGGAFVNEVDGNLTARKDDMTVELHWQEKFRGPDFPPMHFLLTEVTHERLTDSKGRLVRTVVASHLSDTAKDDLTKIAGHDEDELLNALKASKGSSIADLAKVLGWYMANKAPYRSKVQRVLNRLKREGLVKQERRQWVLTPKARKHDKEDEAK